MVSTRNMPDEQLVVACRDGAWVRLLDGRVSWALAGAVCVGLMAGTIWAMATWRVPWPVAIVPSIIVGVIGAVFALGMLFALLSLPQRPFRRELRKRYAGLEWKAYLQSIGTRWGQADQPVILLAGASLPYGRIWRVEVALGEVPRLCWYTLRDDMLADKDTVVRSGERTIGQGLAAEMRRLLERSLQERRVNNRWPVCDGMPADLIGWTASGGARHLATCNLAYEGHRDGTAASLQLAMLVLKRAFDSRSRTEQAEA